MKKLQGGFTLIELLIVVAILGILAAITIPALSRYIQSATIGAANSEVGMVKTSVGAYMADQGLSSVNITTDNITGYMTGTLRGTYSIAQDGTVMGVSYPGVKWVDGKWGKP